LRVPPIKDMRATRDVLYAKGELLWGDTLHVVVAHAPSRRGGEMATRKLRCHVARTICQLADSIRHEESDAKIVLLGDFNAYTGEPSLNIIEQNGLTDVSLHATGTHGARATYRYQGRWASLDHIFVSESLAKKHTECHIIDAPFLTEEDEKYGGLQPRRTYVGYRYHGGSSDHLPIVMKIKD
jgi:endonuclease/exonuclease/phosphatase family metal-dependent hydrolase